MVSLANNFTHPCYEVEGDRGVGDREKRGREAYRRWERRGREAGEKGKNCATLHEKMQRGRSQQIQGGNQD